MFAQQLITLLIRKIIIIFSIILFHFFSIVTVAQYVDFTYTEECFGDSTLLISISGSSDSIVSTDWDLVGNGIFNDASGDSVKHLFPTTGIHNVGLRVITETGSSKAIYKQVEVGSFPFADFSTKNACYGDNTSFLNESFIDFGNIKNYIWYFGDGTQQSYLENPSHFYNSTGTFIVSLKVISNFGCADSIVKSIQVYPIPEITLEIIGDTVIFEGESVTLKVTGSYDTVLWSTGETSYSITVFQAGSYTVEVFKNGCSNTRTVEVLIEKRPGYMNLITPNGDGFNDKWQIYNLNDIGPCSVYIYNRWGNEVFSSSNYQNKWYGTYNGNPLQEGTYYFIYKCLDNKIHKGTVNILR